MARHFLAIANHPLRRRRFVIDVTRVDVGAVIEQELRDRDRAREVERRLAVATAGVDESRIRRDERVEPRPSCRAAPPRGRRRSRPRSMRNDASPWSSSRTPKLPAHQWLRALTSAPGAEQHVDHVAVAVMDGREQRRPAERAVRQRIVEVRFQPGILFEHRAHTRRIVRAHRAV